jgi:protein-S-isoprenylcysteine O-methyltransferase Ste14
VHILLVVSAFVLLFFEPLRTGVLGRSVVPPGTALHLFGLCLVVLGLAFTTWARIRLGQHWSGAVAVGSDHRLVEAGPYAIVRHPIYSGLVVAVVGSALVVRDIAAVLAIPTVLLAYGRKLRIEERSLSEAFGQPYASYRHRVGGLLPFRSLSMSLRRFVDRSHSRLIDATAVAATIERLRTSGHLSGACAQLLQKQISETGSKSAYVLRHLGAHVAIGLVFAFDIVPLPLGTLSRVAWVVGNRVYESGRGSRERARVHSFKVMFVAAIPWVGYGAYLLPLRRENAATAYLYAQHLSYAISGVPFDEFLATKPRLFRAIGVWLVPPVSEWTGGEESSSDPSHAAIEQP